MKDYDKHDEAEASGERRVRCNHCMSVYDEEYIEVDAGGPDTGETCPCCGKGDALMDMSRPAPRDEKALRVCGNCEHGKRTSLDDTRCYKSAPYLPTGRHCAACADWEQAIVLPNPILAREAPKGQA
jgi:hypothetical protein